MVANKGSSPRVRGSLEDITEDVKQHGIIPAGAGLTLAPTICRSFDRDHPRGCGAHHSQWKPPTLSEGSSPRVRGSLQAYQAIEDEFGIIPAGAGLT